MAFNCPKCGAVTYTKTSKSMSSETRRSYHQCQNMLCGCSFTTITSVEIYLTKTIPQELPEGFEIPMEKLPRSHRGEKQMEMF
ncbi:TPA: ogr/Delta-like zinc finger family protein [Providencia rettgeri]|uniref:ogr/Delta-like zinc finger family protein n=1 Tax=Providencia sp. PROV076 TaxID=2949798 RepID=UPI0023499D1D|nr:ogr/Delta-like zinc finger family protein [Providencia sp. PROV076]